MGAGRSQGFLARRKHSLADPVSQAVTALDPAVRFEDIDDVADTLPAAGRSLACMPGLFVSHRQRRDAIRLVVRGLVHPRRHWKEMKIGIHAARKRRRFPCEPRLKSLPIEHEWHAPMPILCAIASVGRGDGER